MKKKSMGVGEFLREKNRETPGEISGGILSKFHGTIPEAIPE